MTLDQHYKLSSKKPDKGPQNANFSSLLGNFSCLGTRAQGVPLA
jgi:hypothetical protein